VSAFARIRRIVALALSLAAASAVAAPLPSVRLEELTSPEVAAAIASGTTTILIPIGGTEQNGPHMTLGKHNVRAKALADKIARALGNALVAPVIAYVPEGSVSPPAAHMRFAGTISIPEAAFADLLTGAARSFRQHGFRDIVLLGDHGGYQKIDKAVALKLNREWAAAGSAARVHAIDEYYRVVDVDYPQLLKRRGHTDAQIGLHAGLADTSLALAIDPSLVRSDRLAASGPDKAAGVQGDPRLATAELGALGVDIIVTRTVEAIRRAVAQR
jgi:creatinine amidohydrolase/Fe(II)-dependent formamide hydrolase-like protein